MDEEMGHSTTTCSLVKTSLLSNTLFRTKGLGSWLSRNNYFLKALTVVVLNVSNH